jgi:hypothetical protein
MTSRRVATFYLHSPIRQQAQRGKHNFIAHLCAVLRNAGYQIAFDDGSELARLRALARPGRGIYWMDQPVLGRGVTIRPHYIGPFWHITASATRWDWPVAKAAFDPATVDQTKAQRFYRFWQDRLFGAAMQDCGQDGFVFIPLQGKLTSHRSFQLCSPVDMIRATLRHDPSRPVIATLHPKESYDADELAALDALASTNPRLFIRQGDADTYLQRCDYVVTQNSGAAFRGFFFGKPAILFAQSDFPHIALNVGTIGAETAFARVLSHRPDYAAYVYWALQLQSINAGRPDAQDRIAAALRALDWPL